MPVGANVNMTTEQCGIEAEFFRDLDGHLDEFGLTEQRHRQISDRASSVASLNLQAFFLGGQVVARWIESGRPDAVAGSGWQETDSPCSRASSGKPHATNCWPNLEATCRLVDGASLIRLESTEGHYGTRHYQRDLFLCCDVWTSAIDLGTY